MNERPLSPHLQIYRLPLTAILSITHRITGVFVVVGIILLVLFLMGFAEGGEQRFLSIQSFLRSSLGRLSLWAWICALFFHLCHGVRHLIWDTGHGFSRATLSRFAYLEIAASIILTLMVFGLTRIES